MAQPQLLIAPIRRLLLQISCFQSRYTVSACSSSVKWSEFKKQKKPHITQMEWEESRCIVKLPDPKSNKFHLTKAEGQRRLQQATQGSDLVSCSATVRIASLITSLEMHLHGSATRILLLCETFKICNVRNYIVHKGVKYTYTIFVAMLSLYLLYFLKLYS